MLGVIFGVLALLSMLSVGEGAKQEALRQIEQLGTNNVIIKSILQTPDQEKKARERLSSGLNMEDLKLLRSAHPEITHSAGLREIETEILGAPAETAYQFLAVGGEYQAIKGLKTAGGRFLCSEDEKRRNLVCVLGWDISNEFGGQGRPGAKLRVGDHIFKVVGVVEKRDRSGPRLPALADRDFNKCVFIPLSSARCLVDDPGNNTPLSEISFRFENPQAVLPGSRILDHLLSRLHYGVSDYQMIIPQELLRQAHQTQRIFNIVLGGIAAISLLVGGIGIMNIMLATVSERTREIGIRRAVGASRKDIVAQFLTEAVVLTVSGSLIGILLGCLAPILISALAGWRAVITGWAILLAILMALAVGITSGLYPALKAARLDPVQALRYE